MSTEAGGEPEQLVLDLPHRQALGAEDFLVSASNQAVVDLVDLWPEWSHPTPTVSGPERAGKSHLVHVWQLRSGAVIVAANALGEDTIRRFDEAPAMAIEDIDRGIADERVLFHLMNLARERKKSVLLTSRASPGEIAIRLPDLRSRLRASPVYPILPPDSPLLKAVLVKLFTDRQLVIEPHVVNHLALHMERSILAAERVVDMADRLALSLGRRVSRAVAAEALRRVAKPQEDEA